MHDDLGKAPHAEYPIVVTTAVLETTLRDFTEGWHQYAEIYRNLIELFNLSPTMAVGYIRGVPTISVDEMVTSLKRRSPDLQLLIDEHSVRLLATIFSWRTGAVITQQFMNVCPDLPLLMEILEEEGCFN